MALLYKWASVGLTWLTAAMTAVAGMPHFSCACPDGSVKPVCVKTTNQSSDCCCAGMCCSKEMQPSEGQKKKSCCSGDSHRIVGLREVRDISISPSCCTRTFAQPQTPAVSHVRVPVVRDYVASVFLTSSTFDPHARQEAGHGSNSWQARAGSPPTDFLALFRHYVI